MISPSVTASRYAIRVTTQSDYKVKIRPKASGQFSESIEESLANFSIMIKHLFSLITFYLLVVTSSAALVSVASPADTNDLRPRQTDAAQSVKEWIGWSKGINFVDGVGGGWERWAQVDYAASLISEHVQVSLSVQPFIGPYQAQTADVDVRGLFLLDLKTYNFVDNVLFRMSLDFFYRNLRNSRIQFRSQAVTNGYLGYNGAVIGVLSGYGALTELKNMYGDTTVTLDNYVDHLKQRYPDFEHDFVQKEGSRQGYVVSWTMAPLG